MNTTVPQGASRVLLGSNPLQTRIHDLTEHGVCPVEAEAQARSELAFDVTVPGLFVQKAFKDVDAALRYAVTGVYLRQQDRYAEFKQLLLDGHTVSWAWGNAVIVKPFINI